MRSSDDLRLVDDVDVLCRLAAARTLARARGHSVVVIGEVPGGVGTRAGGPVRGSARVRRPSQLREELIRVGLVRAIGGACWVAEKGSG